MSKEEFRSKVENILVKTGPNSLIMSDEQYDKIVAVLGRASTTESSDFRPEERLIVRRYKMTVVNGVTMVFRATNNKEVVRVAQLFDVLDTCHKTLCHGGRDKMVKELSSKYHNIPRPVIQAYLDGCVQCEMKKRRPRAGQVSKPILTDDMNRRGQVDLINWDTEKDGEYRYIMVYQDHLTKFTSLRPLKTKRAEEVARELVDIFCTFGAPNILHSGELKYVHSKCAVLVLPVL